MHCDKMQNYFGKVIREDVGNKDGMKREIWAVHKHMIRDDTESLMKTMIFALSQMIHSWCKF